MKSWENWGPTESSWRNCAALSSPQSPTASLHPLISPRLETLSWTHCPLILGILNYSFIHKNKWKFHDEDRLNGVCQKRQWFVPKDWWCLHEIIHLYWHTHKHVGSDNQEIQILITKGLTVGSARWVKRRHFLSRQWEQIEHGMNFCEGRWEEANNQGSVDIHLFYGADASSLSQPALDPAGFLVTRTKERTAWRNWRGGSNVP